MVIDARNTALAMLGYQRWLPRNVAHHPLSAGEAGTTIAPQVPHLPQRSDAVAVVVQQDRQPPSSVAAQHRVAAAPNTNPLHLAEGVTLTGQGVLISDAGLSFAWFMPLPWRDSQGWQVWRDPAEQHLLAAALSATGCDRMFHLLKRYTQVDLSAVHVLPDAGVEVTAQSLPQTTRTVYCFSGIAQYVLTGQENAGDLAMIDWQGRQVKVRCLPHPYRCLIDPASKKRLWQELVKITYEI